ncbi:FadR/GntR family transcriptional regulator [Stenotrophomonas sp. 24(2023)]|uniref:FadR/GntR family transcriptional regulator n=1 Tax=Stenotrophomonas sp. 24(2023) TaxID=3068324 RepID=UPI0027E0A06F|nr:FadR/GntR family transcriptional regulator [Stenotrophomonas sp. 24(2023)]WMJ68233.1 FadR/GntR family transcriptional regulator [Stenotrophomonas sp. 24(2023)]
MKQIAVRNLYDQVTQQIGRQIVSGAIKPGEYLPREELLAQTLSVSRTALREGLKVLGSKGLIETRQKTGTRVREPRYWKQLDSDILAWRCASMPTQDFVEKLVEMREVIEPAAAASAAQRRSPAQLARIKAAYQAMADATDQDAWARADLEFHECVLEATNNELLASLFSVIDAALGTFFLLSAQTAKDFKYSLPRHFQVYDAIRLKQPEAARNAMLDMIADSRANLKGARSRKPAR